MKSDYSTPEGKFTQQMHQAKQRGIEWLLTFEQWWAIWQQSGKWESRGKRAGQYVMAREADTGPYAVGNVKIITFSENIKEAYLTKPAAMRVRGKSRVERVERMHGNMGRGRGWTFRAGFRKPYQVMIKNHYVGSFFTQQEAENAYRSAVKKFTPPSLSDAVTR